MKLYATVSSERASKGQGGNEFIAIDLADEHGRYGWIRINPTKEGADLVLGLNGHKTVSFRGLRAWEDETKGNKQKGDDFPLTGPARDLARG